MSLPEPSSKDSPLTAQFLDGQRLFRNFWKRWSADWLSHLQSRPKWRNDMDNLQLNDMEIIKDDLPGTSEWKLGPHLAD